MNTRQAVSGKSKEQASNGGTRKLANPIQDEFNQTKMPTNEGAERDSGVQMATGDVGGVSDAGKKGEPVGQCGYNNSCGSVGTVTSKLAEGHAWALASENKYKGAKEFRKGRSEYRTWRISRRFDGYSIDRHCDQMVEKVWMCNYGEQWREGVRCYIEFSGNDQPGEEEEQNQMKI